MEDWATPRRPGASEGATMVLGRGDQARRRLDRAATCWCRGRENCTLAPWGNLAADHRGVLDYDTGADEGGESPFCCLGIRVVAWVRREKGSQGASRCSQPATTAPLVLSKPFLVDLIVWPSGRRCCSLQ